MAEPLTTQLVMDELKRLHVAFPQNIGMRSNPAGTADVYRNGLRGLSGDAVRAAADRAIQDGKFFPKVAELRELAAAYDRHHAPPQPAIEAEPLWCNGCRTRAEWRSFYRPAITPKGQLILSDDGAAVVLEIGTRLLCKCAPADMYLDDAGLDGPAMQLTTIPAFQRVRAIREQAGTRLDGRPHRQPRQGAAD